LQAGTGQQEVPTPAAKGETNVQLRENLFITQNQMYDFKSQVPTPAGYPLPA
jgi:hypothetical protein